MLDAQIPLTKVEGQVARDYIEVSTEHDKITTKSSNLYLIEENDMKWNISCITEAIGY